MFQHFQTGVSFYFPLEAYIFWEFLFGIFFFWFGGVRGLSAFGSLVFRFLGFLATRLLIAFLSCTVCWLLGFSASRLVGLSTSYSLVYFFILCYITLYYVILNYIKYIYI